MPRKLTKQVVDQASFDPEGTSFQWVADSELRGFGLRVHPTKKSFALRYRTKSGVLRYHTLGTYPGLTIAEARTLAKEKIGQVASGRDPAAERRKSRESTPSSLTVREFGRAFLSRMKKRLSERTYGEYERRIRTRLIPSLGGVRLTDLNRREVADLLDRIRDSSGPYESNRTHELIRTMYNRASEWGVVPEELANPARGITRHREKPRTRWLKPIELERLMVEVALCEDPYFRAFVRLLLLTGLRKSELLGARWDHLDPERREILLPKTKSGQPQVRTLSEPALEIFHSLAREEGNPHVFPGRDRGTHRRDFKSRWGLVRKEAGLEDVTMHDLRRTAGSYMAQAGVPLQVIGEVLGHQSEEVTKVYARLSEDNRRDAVETLGNALGGLLDGATL